MTFKNVEIALEIIKVVDSYPCILSPNNLKYIYYRYSITSKGIFYPAEDKVSKIHVPKEVLLSYSSNQNIKAVAYLLNYETTNKTIPGHLNV